jgi:hypothetical protein
VKKTAIFILIGLAVIILGGVYWQHCRLEEARIQLQIAQVKAAADAKADEERAAAEARATEEKRKADAQAALDAQRAEEEKQRAQAEVAAAAAKAEQQRKEAADLDRFLQAADTAMNTAHRIQEDNIFLMTDKDFASGLANLKADVSAAIRSATEIGLDNKNANVSNFVSNAKSILISYDAIHFDIEQAEFWKSQADVEQNLSSGGVEWVEKKQRDEKQSTDQIAQVPQDSGRAAEAIKRAEIALADIRKNR